MKLWNAFYDLVVPDLPGCPLVVVEAALRRAAIAFCEQSLVWKAEHDEIDVVSGTADYAFVPPSGAVVHAIDYAEFDGEEIESHAGRTDIEIEDWRNETGTPEYVLGGATSLLLVPEPDVDGTLTLTVILKPTPTATGVEDFIFNEYRETIVHGALARLMQSPRKPYTDAALSVMHQQQFAIGAGQAGNRVARDYTRAPLRTSILRRGA
jgi:hypothetical protein